VASELREAPERFPPGVLTQRRLRISVRYLGLMVLWPHKESREIGEMELSERHLVTLTSDGKRIQSFWFRFPNIRATTMSGF